MQGRQTLSEMPANAACATDVRGASEEASARMWAVTRIGSKPTKPGVDSVDPTCSRVRGPTRSCEGEILLLSQHG